MKERFPAVFDRINFIKEIGPYRTIDQKIEKHIDKYEEEKKKEKQRLIDKYIQFRKNGGKNK